MLKKHKRLSKDHRRELKKKPYYTIQNVVSNNLRKDERLKMPTLTLKRAVRMKKRYIKRIKMTTQRA